MQLESFVKAAQKVGKGIGSLFKKKQDGAGSAGAVVSLDDLMLFSNVRWSAWLTLGGGCDLNCFSDV